MILGEIITVTLLKKIKIQSMTSSLVALLRQSSILGDSEIQELVKYWTKEKRILRSDFLIQKGQIEQYLYFVKNGVLRIFLMHEDKEFCVGFAYTDTFICSFPSFVSNLPSDYYIQALQNVDVIGISRSDFFKLCEQFLNIERFWRISLEHALLGRIQRETEMLTLTPTERFEHFFRRSKHLLQIVPQKHIAAYLGMSPETLSRLKSKLE
ncbi:MAG: hypothetical protein OHK0038_16920 [Flammeovirgaceae bacterium]